MRRAWVTFTRADGRPMSELRVEVPETAEECRRGLAGRPRIGPDQGMLFDLGGMRRHGLGGMNFTTVGMLFPLDFLVVDEGRVGHVLERVRPGVRQVLAAIVDYVVEAPAGWAGRSSVVPGSAAIVMG